jgi:hypothetical protein
MHRKYKKCVINFGWEAKRIPFCHSEGLSVEEKVTLK